MGTTSDTVIETAKKIGAGLEATRARQAHRTESRLQTDLDAARAATDAAIHALKERAGKGLSNQDIADLLGVADRQTVHMRAKRHVERTTTTKANGDENE